MEADESKCHGILREAGDSCCHRVVSRIIRLQDAPRGLYLHRVWQEASRSGLTFIRAIENVIENDIAVLIVEWLAGGLIDFDRKNGVEVVRLRFWRADEERLANICSSGQLRSGALVRLIRL